MDALALLRAEFGLSGACAPCIRARGRRWKRSAIDLQAGGPLVPGAVSVFSISSAAGTKRRSACCPTAGRFRRRGAFSGVPNVTLSRRDGKAGDAGVRIEHLVRRRAGFGIECRSFCLGAVRRLAAARRVSGPCRGRDGEPYPAWIQAAGCRGSELALQVGCQAVRADSKPLIL